MEKYKNRTLKFNIFLIFLAMALGLNFAMLAMSFVTYSKTIDSESQRISMGVSNAIVSGINGNRVDDWIKDRRMEEYSLAEKEIINFVRANDEIDRISVYKMQPTGMQVIFDVDRNFKNENFLASVSYGEKLADVKNDLLYGYQIDSIKYENDEGSFITTFTPVKSTLGDVVCYVVCEMSLNNLKAERGIFATAMALALMLASFVLCIVYLYIKRTVVSPLTRIDKALQMFADDNRAGDKTIEVLTDKGQNEISEFASMNEDFISLINDVRYKNDKVEDLSDGIIANVANMVNMRNTEDTSNADAITDYTLIIIDNMRRKQKYKKVLTDIMIDAILTAIPIYDLGEISVSNDILNKSGRLTDEEFEMLKKHTESGKELVEEIMLGLHDEFHIEVAKQIAQYHHERWDGSGYMEHLKGNKIPLPARIIAVADVFNALVSDKSYRGGMSVDDALDVIKSGSKTQFDKDVVDAFLRGESSIRRIARKYKYEKN